jgi:flagellar basal-body rod protein FlgB
MRIFDDVFGGLERAMDLRFQRHTVLASNAANSETPNYRAREIDFAGQLEKAFNDPPSQQVPLEKTNALHMDILGGEQERVVLDDAGQMGADGNNVDLDITMGKISDNGRAYEAAASLFSQKLRLLRVFVRRGGI